jgi:uncharacterized protein (TIGR04255 family)
VGETRACGYDGMSNLPRKLSPDAVVEAILEARFESSGIPELTVGALASVWKSYAHQRLPMANLPAPMRTGDPNLKYQPTLQLTSPDGREAVKIGENVVSLHAIGVYPGWQAFQPSLHRLIDTVLSAIAGARITRLGLRYVNLLTLERHGIKTIADLNVDVQIAGKMLQDPMLLTYRHREGERHHVLVKVSSPEFVHGPTDPFSAFVDIDVATSDNDDFRSVDSCFDWIEYAHEALKEHFFALLSDETVERLKEA